MTFYTRRTAGGRCPCGAEHAAYGPPSTSVPVDRPEEAAVGGPLRKYRVTVGATATVMKLNDRDAERLGGVPLDVPPEPAVEAGPATSQAKARSAANKARPGARNKAVSGGGD
nr:hypothetical protein KPHV_60790 [Kitasatospora purpeofusca]